MTLPMNKDFVERQKTLVSQRLEEVKDENTREKRELTIIAEYLSSLLHPENYTEAQTEDLRKLALELEYKEDTEFTAWEATVASRATELS